MSIKPVCDCIEKADGVWFQRCECRNSGDLAEAAAWCAVQNSIPDTHRVVPVELLKEWAHDLDAEINARDIAEQMLAIIEEKPCSQS